MFIHGVFDSQGVRSMIIFVPWVKTQDEHPLQNKHGSKVCFRPSVRMCFKIKVHSSKSIYTTEIKLF